MLQGRLNGLAMCTIKKDISDHINLDTTLEDLHRPKKVFYKALKHYIFIWGLLVLVFCYTTVMFYELYINCKVIFIIRTMYCNFNIKNEFNESLSSYLPKGSKIIEPALPSWESNLEDLANIMIVEETPQLPLFPLLGRVIN